MSLLTPTSPSVSRGRFPEKDLVVNRPPRELDMLKGHLEMVVKLEWLSSALTWWLLSWSPTTVAGWQPWPPTGARLMVRFSARAVCPQLVVLVILLQVIL